MIIDNIELRRSTLHQRAWAFHIEMTGYKFTGYFEDWGGFLTMIQECATFFAVRWGKVKLKDVKRHMTREVAP